MCVYMYVLACVYIYINAEVFRSRGHGLSLYSGSRHYSIIWIREHILGPIQEQYEILTTEPLAYSRTKNFIIVFCTGGENQESK